MKEVNKYEDAEHHNESVDIDHIYSKTFIESINLQADKTEWRSDYINEIFMYFFLKTKESQALVNGLGLSCVDIDFFSSDWWVSVAAAKASGLHVNRKAIVAYHVSNIVLFIFSFVVVFASSFVLPVFVLITRKKQKTICSSKVSVVRAPASYNKMKFLESDSQVEFLFDDIWKFGVSGLSMYSQVSYLQRILSIVSVPYLVLRDCILIIYDSVGVMGWKHIGFVLYYYYKRIVHKCVFEYYLNLILKNNKHVIYYTGNKEDRFAILEMRLCKKYGIKSVCVPHGIEYAFRVPAGLVGDVFYCNTAQAQEHLSSLYSDNDKFVYDKDIAEKMFSRGQPVTDIDKIVFFPESREPEKNLPIIKKLVESGMSIYVKLHILDSADNYKEYSDRFTYIDDFDYAISNSICVARKSTVLVEAVYNNSIPVAVLIDAKDRAYVDYMFPSLQDSHINQVYAFEELVMLIDDIKNNKTLSK